MPIRIIRWAVWSLVFLCAASLTQAATLRWARSSDPGTLDPHAANIGTSFVLLHQMYESLVHRGVDGRLQPLLATSWQLTEDPAVWEFRLRPGVTFHDGSALTAEDVVFSLQRAQGPNSQVRSLLASMQEARAVGDLTVQVRTDGPHLIFPQNLTNLFIMSRAWAVANNALEAQDTSTQRENGATPSIGGGSNTHCMWES